MVAAAAEAQREVFLLLDVWSVDNHIAQLDKLSAQGVLEQRFEAVARVAPYILVGALLDHACKLDEALGVEHRVAARERDVHVGIDYVGEECVDINRLAAILVPRMGVVAPHTMVLAPHRVERGAKSYTIDRCAILDV